MHKSYWISLIILLLPHTAAAQTGTCDQAQAEAFLDAGNVRARIFNNGGLFWRGSPHVYEVPKGSGLNANFANGLWVGGMINDSLRVAATRYGLWEFWPGPLDDAGNPPINCNLYDKIWEIRKKDIEAFIRTGDISSRLHNWPWQLGAPVIDGDGNPNNYNLQAGDLPELYGDQRLWWIMNDRGNVHQSSNSNAIGLEVHASAHAFSHPGFISNSTFYEYRLINKNKAPFNQAFVGVFGHNDLGNFDDNYVGSDSLLHLGFVYNADNEDEGGEGYGVAPPAIGITIFETTQAESDNFDNNRNGLTDEPEEKLGAYGVMQFFGGGCVTCEPVEAADYYNYLQSRWKDSTALVQGSWGYQRDDMPKREVTRFAYSGDPVNRSFWSAFNNDGLGNELIPPGARRFSISSGPYNLAPTDTVLFRFAIVWSRGTDHLDSVTQLKQEVQEIRDFATSFYTPQSIEQNIPEPIESPLLGFDQNFPNPFSQSTTLRYSLPQTMQVRLAVYDLLGREVAVLVNAQQEAGIYTAQFDAGSLPAGIYLARIELDFLRFTQRMVLIK
ncbi:MAG: T9SS type A sorting domain-containing protein [Bacteroidota bacterium]